MNTDTALLVIDVQAGVVGDAAYHREEVLSNIKLLLERARSSGTPVIYVQHNDRWMEVGTPDWEILPAVKPHAGEPAIRKEAPDSFHETRLQEELAAHGIKRLVIAGAQTQICIDSTVRRAVAEGYDVLLAGDAHTTDDSETLPAEKIVAFFNETLDGFWAGEHKVKVQPASKIQFASA